MNRLLPASPASEDSVISKRAFTVIELMVVISVIAILAALLIPSFNRILMESGKANCMNNMRQLHVAFSAYMQDNKMWPQQPTNIDPSDGDAYEAWWITTMYPYAPEQNVWICPVLRGMHIVNASGNPTKMNYTPSMFDASPFSPYRWPTQPWMIENANAHGQGPLVIMPDGSVTALGILIPGLFGPH